ncbi:ABC transporter related [Methylobacterium sp. 4-46]|uniref:ABC transporter ATP-binding protein n=1 Tax=unclassified Methylobacterium TaxID=2615210 RepID=UPI000152CEEE|nr:MULTISPECIES: sn-glycerol-3-phosphate ABC transporter ATP-binding protein UgpC [Methylobacterium]ACA15832.1 ABC transporter related [Methylobacterium sp. 4-46]WFT81560.1 sn-glycerol-3-phosphate ABC transporter ATP-binding protein UgpC [Methylobacterium nodulans]
MAVVRLDRISKRYGAGVVAVDEVDLTVGDGEFMVLLGPSGCGKSTTLRMIAGLETISSGTLSVDGRVVNDVPAKDRDMAMVFQSYALYPHMSVYENMAFGLRRRRTPGPEIERRVRQAAEILGLVPLLARKPHALSGGQRQRVALGRAMVREPMVFLFDEPLSNLDAALRVNTRNELIKQHHRLGATMIYVTHDQVEAMTMGTRICVMNGGRVAQIGAPLDVYWNPADTFVARFLGAPPMNLFPARLAEAGVAEAAVTAPLARWRSGTLGPAGREIVLGVRAEDLHLDRAAAGEAGGSVRGRVVAVEPLGAETLLVVEGEGGAECTARLPRGTRARVDEAVELHFAADAAYLFDAATRRAIPADVARRPEALQ